MSANLIASETVAAAEPTGARKPALIETISVALFFVLCALAVFRLLTIMQVGQGVWIALAFLVGYVMSDFVSGFVHWLFDTWGSPSTPVVGATFITPFRVHHSDPKDITRHGFIATNGHNCLASVPVLIIGLLLPVSWSGSLVVLSFLLALCLGVFATNQFHKWAHQDSVSPLIRWLQQHKVVLSPEHHDLHHQAPYLTNYCITTGWLNRPLNAIRFFRTMERCIQAVTGTEPRVDDLKK